MRILILSTRLGGGGTRRYALELARALAHRMHEVAIAAPDIDASECTPIPCFPLESAEWRSVPRVLQAFRPHAVRLISGAFPPDTRWGVKLHRRSVPTVESLHVLPMRTGVGALRSAFYRWRGRRGYRCVTLSPGMTEEVRRLCPAIRGALVGMRYGMVIPTPGRTRAPEGSGLRFLTVTRLEERQKAVGVLLEAFRSALDRLDASPPPSLSIVGDGPDRAALEARAEELGLRNAVRFEGWAQDAVARMRAADVFILSTRHESFGRVNVEAAAVGLAVIASDDPAGGCRESVADGVNGVLVPPGDVESLATAILRMHDDHAWRERLGNAGPRHAASFAIDRHAAETEALLHQVTAPRDR